MQTIDIGNWTRLYQPLNQARPGGQLTYPSKTLYGRADGVAGAAGGRDVSKQCALWQLAAV